MRRKRRGALLEEEQQQQQQHLTEAVEEVKEEAKDEYENLTWEEIIEREYGGGTQKSSMVSPLASRSTSRRYDLGGRDGSRNDDDDDSKDYWETRMQPLRCVVVGVGKKGRPEFKKNEKKKRRRDILRGRFFERVGEVVRCGWVGCGGEGDAEFANAKRENVFRKREN